MTYFSEGSCQTIYTQSTESVTIQTAVHMGMNAASLPFGLERGWRRGFNRAFVTSAKTMVMNGSAALGKNILG
jgi:hypothetical protein